MAFGPGVLCLFLWTITGSSCEQCREGATYSGAVISPNLETTKIMRVPHALSVSDCIAACCDLSGCDLSWMFERRCYIVNCQHKDNCEPKKIETVKSYLIFVLRPAQRTAPLLGFGQVIPSMVHSVGLQNEPSEEVSSLKKLSLLGKDPSLEEIPEYIDDYKELEQDPFQVGIKHEQKDSMDYADWGLMVAGENGFNTSTGDDGDNEEDFAEKKVEAGKVESFLNKNSSELTSINEHSTERSSLPEITPLPGMTFEREAAVPLPQPEDALQKEAASPSSSSDKPDFSPGVPEKTQTPTAAPENATEGGIMLLPTNTAPSEPVQQFTQPATAAKAVKELTVSAGDNIQVMLPKNEVELNAFAVPPPSTETAYTYEWSLISHPPDYSGEMEHRHSQTLKLSHLSVGLYAFKVTVSGENAFGEGFVNVTVKPALRINQPPAAVASPRVQEVSLPTTSTFIDGSQSTDDVKIVSYHWEEIKGPLREQKASADTPVLHLSNLVPGNYTFRLTVIDSDGAANSTIASLTVNKPVDYPPIANAGPNQAVTLPQNFITLNGNQSSDDHEIVSYEWSLSPRSKGKVVAMQGVRTPYLQLSAMQEGDYTFQLTVTDSARQRSTAEVTLIVQPENNSPPIAVAGPDKELTFPVESTTLDGSKSQDDQGIVFYHWENISGPSSVQMENDDKAIATVTGLQVGTYHFRLTVKDQQGLSSASVLSITVKEENNSPPRAHAGGKHILVLPNNSVTLDGSGSADDQGIVSYLWIRDGQSPAAGDVIHGSDHEAVLQLTNLVEGTYIFHLKVTDAKGDSDVDSATVEVRPDPRRSGLVELILQVGVGQLSEQQKDTLVRQLAVLLNVLDSDIKVQKIQAYSDISTAVVFYVQSGHPSTGAVYVYFGTEGRGLASQPNVTITCQYSYCNLGWSLLAADVDGNGNADLVVGSPYAPGGGKQRGFVVAFYSHFNRSDQGLLSVHDANWMVEGEENYAWFGFSLASCHLENMTLLLIGSPTWKTCSSCNPLLPDVRQSVGKVYGYNPPSTEPWFEITGDKEMGRMGLSLASGVLSVAGNTRNILVVGAPTADSLSRILFMSSVLHQSGLALVYDLSNSTKPSLLSAFSGDRRFSRFGGDIYLSDLDSDGLDEMMVASPLRTNGVTSILSGGAAGRVYIYNGRQASSGNVTSHCTSWTSPCPEDWAQYVLISPEELSRFGSSITTVKSERKKQVIVAAERSSAKARLGGRLFVYSL